MNLETLQSQRQAILHIAAKHGAFNQYIFGSVARQESTPNSDLDLLAELETQRTLLDQIALIQDLQEFLGCPVDVVEPDSLHDLIRDQILQEAIPL
ncbi:MAG: nucleotidyltransferase family protein [Synechococcaceae cyanobacterium SM2_3_1]|nr:nucleotidyltransferase family protein [Synechococcaceae cyanobacterium SM2_3_1]